METQPNFIDLLDGRPQPVISLEFFPPKRAEDLPATKSLIQSLQSLKPNYATVTYGAGGSTKDFTRQLVAYIAQDLKLPVAAHLTCVNHSRKEITQILDTYQELGLQNLVALRGDPPQGQGTFQPHPEGFSCARDLCAFIKENYSFCLAAAAYPEKHPQALSWEADLSYLKEKVSAGAELLVTQLFFDNQLYFDFVDRARQIGITQPIIPGIMPVSNYAQLERFTKLCGASIPKLLQDPLNDLKERPADLIDFGIEYAIAQCRELLDSGVPGIHLYTLNKNLQTAAIIKALREEL